MLHLVKNEKELNEYEKIKRQLFNQRITSLNIRELRFLLSHIIMTTPHIEDNKHLIEFGLINNKDDENMVVEMMLNKFTETDIQNKIKLYKSKQSQNEE